MKKFPLNTNHVALDPFRVTAAWTAMPRRQAMLLGPDGMVLRLIRNRRTLRVTLSFPTIQRCAQRGGLLRTQGTFTAGPVSADLFPGQTNTVALCLADLAWGHGARETRALLGRIAQVLAPQDQGRDPADTGIAEAAEISFAGPNVILRVLRRHAVYPGIHFHGPWRVLPPALSARVLLAVPPLNAETVVLAAAPVLETAHGRASLHMQVRAELEALGENPTSFFEEVL